MRTYPTSTANYNVLPTSFLVAETSNASEEQKYTYYITEDGRMWKCGDWMGDSPEAVTLSTLCRLTGDTEQMLLGRFQSWVYYHKQHEKVSADV